MNIVDLAILKKMVAGGGGSGTDNYNDLSNLPQINGETLAGNKTAANLGLQDALTFDSTPTEDSTNPVESGGVYTALAGKQDNLTFDDDPTENSTNPVKSGGVYSELAGKQDNLTFDGVYNASTNKAATESTVTNAIAGLDVSDFSVDADETISSISETDGKISVTKQDIAIASNQVVAMTGYTKPSIAPANPAILTNDTANQAFGKLEFKADTNQNLILYGINTGAWNVCPAFLTKATKDGVTLTSDSTGVHITGTQGQHTDGSSDVTQFLLTDEKSTLKAGTYVFSGTASDAGYNQHRIYFGFEDGTYVMLDTANPVTRTFSTDMVLIRIDIYLRYPVGTVYNLDLTPMIVDKRIWDTLGHDYHEPSLQNFNLTRLEAEDRAALAEVVDSGAKNKLKYDLASLKTANTSGTWNNNAYTVGGITYTLNSDMSISISGTKPAGVNAIFNLADYTAVSGDLLSQGTVGVLNVFLYARGGSSSCNNIGYTNIESTDIGVTRTYALAVTVEGSAVNQRYYPMICTLADWKVSQKYVPYRPSYDLVSNAVNTVNKIALDTSNSYTVDINSITYTSYMVIKSNSTNFPSGVTGQYSFLRTDAFDGSTGRQELTLSDSSDVYVRTRSGQTWHEWKKLN